MERERFEALVAEMWEQIPADFRAGIEAVAVEERAEPHPEHRDVYTLGECVADRWPSPYSEEGGDLRSRVVLYYGSFLELSRIDPDFHWREEIWETLLHELLHHREWAASEDGLELFDEAMEESFRRGDGHGPDPDFWRWLNDARGEGAGR